MTDIIETPDVSEEIIDREAPSPLDVPGLIRLLVVLSLIVGTFFLFGAQDLLLVIAALMAPSTLAISIALAPVIVLSKYGVIVSAAAGWAAKAAATGTAAPSRNRVEMVMVPVSLRVRGHRDSADPVFARF